MPRTYILVRGTPSDTPGTSPQNWQQTYQQPNQLVWTQGNSNPTNQQHIHPPPMEPFGDIVPWKLAPPKGVADAALGGDARPNKNSKNLWTSLFTASADMMQDLRWAFNFK
jgi:hypothetical protein